MAEFTKDRYGVDVLKVEVPINMKFVEGTQALRRRSRPTRSRRRWTRSGRSADVATKPFIYLSAGVSNAEFTETLELAAEAGTRFSGVLCGRATWKDGIPIYGKQGADAFRKWLETEGVKNIANVNDRLKAAHPWFEFYGAKSADELASWRSSTAITRCGRSADLLRSVSTPHLAEAGVAGVRDPDRVDAELGRSGQRDRARRQARDRRRVPCARPA